MPIRKDKKGQWHIEVCIDLQRIHRRLPEGASKRDAEELEAELKKAARARELLALDPPLASLMDAYLKHAESLRSTDTAKHHALRIGQWVSQYRASEAKQCGKDIIKALKPHYKAATINRSLGTLKKALSIAYDEGIIKLNYGEMIKRLPENNSREVFLTLSQVRHLAWHASDNVRAAIWIALYTGMRRGEIVKMNAAEIHDDHMIILAGNTKTLKRRSVPITEALRPWLAYLPLQIGAEGIKSGFQRARKAANMEHVNFHDLRHSTASLLAQAGVDLHTISKILGHTTTRMSERYAHVQVDQQRDALDKIFGGR
jgi:integrase